ncbi:protein of unknown function [Paraburkholderia dioscoreae]|uniref:Uncharacterized protein n=1 Tax=Paraburkholderia dioscoreae TaxID=2604047 RepID=A0A5Q4YSW6_9BURK|nr:protein of unknown function [Paraburkholderia dioscoreae]
MFDSFARNEARGLPEPAGFFCAVSGLAYNAPMSTERRPVRGGIFLSAWRLLF